MSKVKKITYIIFMQLSVVVYTSAQICSKLAASYKVLSFPFIGLYALEVVILGIYAIIWQQLIRRIDLSIAYANKGTALIWSLIWATCLFHEHIGIMNIIGMVVIIVGVYLINSGDMNTSVKEAER